MIVDSFKRGISAGVVAGLAYGLFLALIANPLVEYLEHAAHDHASHGHEHGVVSELTTTVIGVGSGVLWGILLGAVFGVAYYLFEPSLPGIRSTKAYVLAGAGFLTVSGVPWLALPPVPPGTEQVLTTDVRLVIYGATMALGATICALSLMLFQYFYTRKKHDPFTATGIALSPFLLCAIPIVLIPTNSLGSFEGVVAVFQWLVIFGQVALWTLLAGIYTRLMRRANDQAALSLDDLDDLTTGV